MMQFRTESATYTSPVRSTAIPVTSQPEPPIAISLPPNLITAPRGDTFQIACRSRSAA